MSLNLSLLCLLLHSFIIFHIIPYKKVSKLYGHCSTMLAVINLDKNQNQFYIGLSRYIIFENNKLGNIEIDESIHKDY
ncbi:hypothetical protein BLOT_010675 [Blomia tropicalis]|nr:hypothetical protein BLOT_010675 [Blomia tropicalis]